MPIINRLYQLYLSSSGVTIDTRRLRSNEIYFALKGPNFDGNTYAHEALQQGARYVVIDDPSVKLDSRYVLVKNVLTTLQELANFHRRQLTIPVIALTGSNGKTTTKEILTAVLSRQYRTSATKGNLNNHIGVPLTLLDIPQDTDVAIVEMGANHIGEISMLSQMAEPTHGIITNIGEAHLEGFGGIEGVKKGKSELYQYLSTHNGVVFYSLDEPFLAELLEAFPARNIPFKYAEPLPARLGAWLEKSNSKGMIIAFDSEHGMDSSIIRTHLTGYHNFKNIAAAIAIGKYFKVPDNKIVDAIESYQPTNNRSQHMEWRHHSVFLDAYNANPTSMQAALEAFFELPHEQPTMIILGDMGELGDYSEEGHRKVYRLAANRKPDQLILVGSQFKNIMEQQTGTLQQAFDDITGLKEWIGNADIPPHDIFVKGSRSSQLERAFKA